MKYFIVIVTVVVLAGAFIFFKNKEIPKTNPKLVIGIVVDQMKEEFFYRYYEKYSENGLKKMLNNGFHFKNAHYNYVPTYTGPGHASIFTGTTPSRHGIIANDWFDRKTKTLKYCAGDTDYSSVGSANAGNISPNNLLSSTITDELRIASNHQSKVISLSIKDRGAALPGGQNPNGAYWYDGESGNFITSTYYMNELPKWLQDFNNKKLPSQFAESVWTPLFSIEKYTESTQDLSQFEGLLSFKKEPTFPYNFKESKKGLKEIISSPFGNTLITELGIQAIISEKLGKDDHTDILTLSYSSTDYVGHLFGPWSVELEDTYLRFDLEIAKLIDFLNNEVGESNYLIFLTSDHGVVNIPQQMMEKKYVAGYFNEEKLKESILNKIPQEWIANFSNNQIFLNDEEIVKSNKTRRDVFETIVSIAKKEDFIQEVHFIDDLLQRSVSDELTQKIQNGIHFNRSGDIIMMTTSGYLSISMLNGKGTRTSHGTLYNYDTHIPMIFYGKSIKRGESIRKVNIIDIAPTLSMKLNIPLPSASTGTILEELFE